MRPAKDVASGVLLAAEMTANDDHDWAADAIRADRRDVVAACKAAVRMYFGRWEKDNADNLCADLDAVLEVE